MKLETMLDLNERGVITDTELYNCLVQSMVESSDDQIALSLFDALPECFHMGFRDYLLELANRDFEFRLFNIDDPRSPEEIRLAAIRYQTFLKRVAPQLIERL